MMLNPVLIVLVMATAAIGAAIGYFNQHRKGSRAPFLDWRRGALCGALGGVILTVVFDDTLQPYPEPKNIRLVNAISFDAQLKSLDKPMVVEFFATWCGPCKILSPRLDKLALEFSNRIEFVSVNVDQSPSLAARYQIGPIPTLIFFQPDGQSLDRTFGVLSEADLRAKLLSLVGR